MYPPERSFIDPITATVGDVVLVIGDIAIVLCCGGEPNRSRRPRQI